MRVCVSTLSLRKAVAKPDDLQSFALFGMMSYVRSSRIDLSPWTIPSTILGSRLDCGRVFDILLSGILPLQRRSVSSTSSMQSSMQHGLQEAVLGQNAEADDVAGGSFSTRSPQRICKPNKHVTRGSRAREVAAGPGNIMLASSAVRVGRARQMHMHGAFDR